MNRTLVYEKYHMEMQDIGDIDPQYPMLLYICDRFDLNMEQRYWLAYLFAISYCGPTVYFMYNDFPDFETVDVGRLTRWWERNKVRTVFQTDRKYIKLRDQVVESFKSYRQLIGKGTQEAKFKELIGKNHKDTYQRCYNYFINLFGFGRYSMFLYLESVHVLTGFNMRPEGLDLQNSDTCRNGLCYATSKDKYVSKKGVKMFQSVLDELEEDLDSLVSRFSKKRPFPMTSIWNVETTLCAFRKLLAHRRYLGYYIDRQGEEISTMQQQVKDGVDWSVLWDFRREHFKKKWLKENWFGRPERVREWRKWDPDKSEMRYGLSGYEELQQNRWMM